MAVVPVGKVMQLRDDRELDLISRERAQLVNPEQTHGEVQAYNLCLQLFNALGHKVAKIVNARIIDSVEMSNVTKRRVHAAVEHVRGQDERSITSSAEKTQMLNYLRGHIKGLSEVVKLLSEIE